VIYDQAHFGLRPPLRFTESTRQLPPAVLAAMADLNLDTPIDFSTAWSGPGFPRMIAILFQHPTPYFDDSYAVNSANNGPYGDAILTELIPYLEEHFRIIRKPYARVLTGGSTGGWESIALQIYHPEFFGGTWTTYPDPVDFRHYGQVDIYADTNAFVVTRSGGSFLEPSREWHQPERYIMRAADGQPEVSQREYSRWENVLGSHGRSTDQLEAWESVFGPVGDDGYPKPLWDKRTGHIDHEVAMYMRDPGLTCATISRSTGQRSAATGQQNPRRCRRHGQLLLEPGGVRSPGVPRQCELPARERCLSLRSSGKGPRLATHDRGQPRSGDGRLHHRARASR
jgi:hypothetical protein